MRTKVAVAHVIKHKKITKYRLSQDMGASPTSVDQWLKRTRMSKEYAKKFFELYKIQITDAC